MRLEWSFAALADLGEQVRFVHARNPAVAKRVAGKIAKAAELLIGHPSIGRPGRRAGTREWSVSRLPFVIVYSVNSDVVTILRVFHTRQRR